MELAPIVVFAYCRHRLLESTLAALSKNTLASDSQLYIFCDGPKEGASQEMLSNIAKTRQVAHEQSWAKETYVVESDVNKGLGTSIISGVTSVIEKHGTAIIVEDDLITSPAFLSYMNACLTHYANRKSVFSVTALSRPNPERFYPKDYPYDVFFYPVHRPWGWATWKDRWEQVDWNADVYKLLKEQPYMRNAFQRGGVDNWYELIRQQESGLNVWSVRFGLAHFVNHAVSVAPIRSYVRNEGWGADSTNCRGDGHQWADYNLNENEKINFCDVLYEDARIINAWYSFSNPQRRSVWRRFLNWFGRTFLNKDEFALKGKVYYV